jgi:uroporphyrinogen III methyltransferase/synthase
VARDIIPKGLTEMGAKVDVVTAYRTVNSGRKKGELEGLIRDGKVDVITFTSPSTVIHFFDIMGDDYKIPESIKIACIGPVTVTAAKKLGLRIDIVQETYTVPGMVEAMKEAFRTK